MAQEPMTQAYDRELATAGGSAPESARTPLLISQRDNYAANFGEVLRSSAMFWARQDAVVRTTISITNYWKYKNSLDVTVIVNLRTVAGRLLARTKVGFTDSAVYNFCPPEGFEGSVEVEAFGSRNMRIPYAAVMAIYECADSISMVHSYARAYSQHEIEDGRTICAGEESCWTLRESATLTSFCAFHNGPGRVPAQQVALRVRRADGAERRATIELPALAPYETVIIEPLHRLPDLGTWLDGKPGNGRLSFRLEGGFTRLLCGIRSHDWRQLQVTHSNFDYSVHCTDFVTGPNVTAYMYTPTLLVEEGRPEIVVYPDSTPGRYVLEHGGAERHFSTGQIVTILTPDGTGECVTFQRKDGPMPTRIVTGLRLERDAFVIPAECSLGIAHHERPAKHFSWMVVSRRFDSTVCWTDLAAIYGGCPPGAKLVFKLYRPDESEPLSHETRFCELPSSGAIRLENLFSGLTRWPETFAWVTVWCSYPGLEFYSTMQKGRSISVEHGF